MDYQHAKKILVEKYRSPYYVMVEYRKEIKAWPIIRSGDAEGYQRFYNFLQKCGSITQSVQWNQLDTPGVISLLLAKLPAHTRDRWARHGLSIRRRQMREPDLVDFIELVMDETLLLNDPLFSKSATDIVRDHQKAHNKVPNIKETSKNICHHGR